jgi:signal transduction histidine kinase
MKTKFPVREKDNRINVSATSMKEYGLLFFVMAAFNGFHMTIYQRFFELGMVETHVQLVINALIAYVAITATISMCLIGIVRNVSWNRPMRRISEATRKISKGDFSVRIAPLRKDGKKDFVEVMFDDFNTMAEELESIETLKSDFISNVSHEIKTPLAIIQGYAVALQSDTLSVNERREYTQTIVEASQKLSALVSNILKLNKLENQEILPASHPYNLSEQLRRCAVAFEELWERKNITFTADLEPPPSPTGSPLGSPTGEGSPSDEIIVSYDKDMLEIVWNNLLSNAIKFTGPGGHISLTLKAQDGFAVVVVQDTGCGMDEDTKKHIFDKFYQGDTSHSQEGNGLGLAIVKKVIEIQGGSIAVESGIGQGSIFTVFLKSLPNIL